MDEVQALRDEVATLRRSLEALILVTPSIYLIEAQRVATMGPHGDLSD